MFAARGDRAPVLASENLDAAPWRGGRADRRLPDCLAGDGLPDGGERPPEPGDPVRGLLDRRDPIA
jgi:hypothetical protein